MLRFGAPKHQELLTAQAELNPDYEPPEKPELHKELEDPWEIFRFLHRRRPSGWSQGAITVEAIRIAFDFYRVAPDQEWSYLQMLDALDDHYLEYVKDKADGGTGTVDKRKRC